MSNKKRGEYSRSRAHVRYYTQGARMGGVRPRGVSRRQGIERRPTREGRDWGKIGARATMSASTVSTQGARVCEA